MRFLLSCDRNSTTVWMNHLDANEKNPERTWELLENVACCFEQILEAKKKKRKKKEKKKKKQKQ